MLPLPSPCIPLRLICASGACDVSGSSTVIRLVDFMNLTEYHAPTRVASSLAHSFGLPSADNVQHERSGMTSQHAESNRQEGTPACSGTIWTTVWVLAAMTLAALFVHAAVVVEAVSRLHVVRLSHSGAVCAPHSLFLKSQWHSEGYDWCQPAWRTCVTAMPSLFLLAAAMGAVTWYVRRCGTANTLAAVYAIIGVGFVAVVHGPQFLMLLISLTASYALFTRLRRVLPRTAFLAALWVVQVCFLYGALESNGFESYYLVQRWLPTSPVKSEGVTGVARSPLWPRLMSWSSALRMSTLRMIAFHSDELEAATDRSAASARAALKHDKRCVECAALREAHGDRDDDSVRCYKYRTEHPRDAREYGYVRYMAYMLFPLLYIGGPISSYNAFASHLQTASRVMSVRKMIVYGLRICLIYVSLYTLLHFLFVDAVLSSVPVVTKLSLHQRASLVLYALALLWLKFAFIWRTSRLFALWCGVEAPENMRRCFVNSLTVRDFWRDWHASFNLWIVRYMYVPMGGRRHQLLAVAPIFFFVALWHDHTLSMLKWATCIVVFFAVEVLVTGMFSRLSASVSAALAELDAHDGECARRGVSARVARCVYVGLDAKNRASCARALLCCLCGVGPLLLALSSSLVVFSLYDGFTEERSIGVLFSWNTFLKEDPHTTVGIWLCCLTTGLCALLGRHTVPTYI